MGKDLATNSQELKDIRRSVDENHQEIMDEFRSLRSKVNEEITTMQKTISDNRKFLLRVIIISLVTGSLLWIGESRHWILEHLGSLV